MFLSESIEIIVPGLGINAGENIHISLPCEALK